MQNKRKSMAKEKLTVVYSNQKKCGEYKSVNVNKTTILPNHNNKIQRANVRRGRDLFKKM
ncbi:hypothetical protein DOY81_003075 [Sarcophaga bullata]|nr:hypothetical protein DOY81_003075 [Sarcophaga bullata]